MKVAALFLIALSSAAGAEAPKLTVDVAAARHPISPDIYGINDYSDKGLASELRLGVKRWGGDAATRYNWKNDTYNSGSDYYFHNFAYTEAHPETLPDGSAFDRFVDNNLRTGVKSFGTIPLVGFTPKGRARACSFSVSKYGAQQKADPYDTDCGNGIRADGKTQIINDPSDTSVPVDETFMQDWVRHLIGRYGKANQGGVQLWSLDNEPEWWMGVHIDIHRKPATYDEMASLGIRYAAAIKAVDPSALITGPVPSGWMAFFYSAADFVAGWGSHAPYRYDTNPVDRRAHGDVPFVEWYLGQMQNYEKQRGVRLLDYLDVHAYIAPAGIQFGKANPGTDTLRLTSTRAFWDPGYQFKDDTITEAPRLIPRMQDWVARNYPGTKLAITEYNWGALEDITGAIAQADILGIFGREGLDLATLWGPPDPTQPGANAFRLFLNYDGAGGRFGETSVSAASSDPDQLSIFAAQRSDSALTVMVLNKATSDLIGSLGLANFSAAPLAQVYSYSSAKLSAIVRGADVDVSTGVLTATFPARSISLFVLPASPDTLAPKPVVLAVKNAASWDDRGVAPGEIVVIGGKNLGGDQVRVLFDGVAAPVIYALPDQLAAVVPYVAALRGTTHVQVESQGSRSDSFEVRVVAAAPGLFGAPETAARGDIITLYATGEGVTDPPGVDGRVAADILPKPVQKCAVSIGAIAAEVLYCGAAPGAITGLLQVNVRVPLELSPADNVPVILTVDGVPSQAGVVLSVH